METPTKLVNPEQYSVNELSQLLKARIDFMDANFYSDLNGTPKLCTVEEETRIIAEINILSAHFTANLMLSSI